MLKQSITPSDVCDLLNELLKLDYDCANELVSYRQQCNESVAAHQSIQVQQYKDDPFPKVGIVGVLNGMFGIRDDGMGAICFEIDNGKILGFKITPPTDTSYTTTQAVPCEHNNTTQVTVCGEELSSSTQHKVQRVKNVS